VLQAHPSACQGLCWPLSGGEQLLDLVAET